MKKIILFVSMLLLVSAPIFASEVTGTLSATVVPMNTIPPEEIVQPVKPIIQTTSSALLFTVKPVFYQTTISQMTVVQKKAEINRLQILIAKLQELLEKLQLKQALTNVR
ncbi:MAG: hypothetical protein PHQ35_10650 [Phycisphaerae bacterium]|nr:hypothetical protein [Phycisphaerae bacterium]